MPAAGDEGHGEAERQREKPLLAARGRRPCIGPPEAHGDVIAVRAEPRQPSPEIARPGLDQRGEQRLTRGLAFPAGATEAS